MRSTNVVEYTVLYTVQCKQPYKYDASSYTNDLHNTTVHNTTVHNTTVHNTTVHNTTVHNTTVHNTTVHNTTGAGSDCQHSLALLLVL